MTTGIDERPATSAPRTRASDRIERAADALYDEAHQMFHEPRALDPRCDERTDRRLVWPAPGSRLSW